MRFRSPGGEHRALDKDWVRRWRKAWASIDTCASFVSRCPLRLDARIERGEPMSVPPESIEVGKCYLTDAARVQRVIEITPSGEVIHEHWSTRERQEE